jgi:hypothetical protein
VHILSFKLHSLAPPSPTSRANEHVTGVDSFATLFALTSLDGHVVAFQPGALGTSEVVAVANVVTTCCLAEPFQNFGIGFLPRTCWARVASTKVRRLTTHVLVEALQRVVICLPFGARRTREILAKLDFIATIEFVEQVCLRCVLLFHPAVRTIKLRASFHLLTTKFRACALDARDVLPRLPTMRASKLSAAGDVLTTRGHRIALDVLVV